MKYLASDIDGTLIKDNLPDMKYTILQEDIDALYQWTKENYLIISTGRTCIKTFSLMDRYDIDTPHTYYMTSNGAEIYDNQRNCIYRCTLPLAKSKKALEIIEKLESEYHLLTTIFNGKDIILLQTKEEYQTFNREEKIVNICVESLHRDINEAKACLDALKAQLDDVEVHMNNWYVDIVPQGISKAYAIDFIVKEELKDDSASLVAIGDSYNDVAMLEMADESYTFHRAPQEVKGVAKHLVDHVYECVFQEM